MSSRFDFGGLVWRRSIRGRLTLWYGAILAAVFLFLGGLFYFYLSKNLYSDFDLSLRSTAEALARTSIEQRRSISDWSIEAFLRSMEEPDFLNKFFQFFDPGGKREFRAGNLPGQEFPMTADAFRNALHGIETFETFPAPRQGSFRVLTFPVVQNGEVINVLQVGGTPRHIEATLKKVRFILLFALPTVLILSVLGGEFLTRQALRPVDAMAQVADRIAGGDLSRRIPADPSGDELARLAETFNRMLERLEDSVRRIWQFSADASHELRTPLTILKGETEMALREARTVEEFQQTLGSGLEEINRISKIVEELFLLSKADLGEARLERRPVALASLFKETLSHMEILAKEKHLSLTFDCRDEVTIIGDTDRLRELLLNLVENAIRYTPSEGKIVVVLFRERDEARITVSDTGIGITKEDLQQVFDRFYRADGARALHPKGSGLGLPICKWIVEAHGGTIDVTSEPGRGTAFTLRFPLV